MIYTEGMTINKVLAISLGLIIVGILFLTSFTNVVGYQTVQSSHQQTIKEAVNQRELLFQTIVDIGNNKEIQRIILKSQMSRGILPTSEFPIVTKTQIRQMYFIGLILSKVISKSRMQSMVQQYQSLNPITHEGIQDVIEKDVTLRNEISQLKNSECDCDNRMSALEFTIICEVLRVICGYFGIFPYLFFPIWGSALFIAIILECYWTLP
jgi:hypothetical protein